MMSSSIRLLFTGPQVDCTRNTSEPRTDSEMETEISPVSEGGGWQLADRQSERRSDLHRQCGMGVAGENFDVFSVRNH